jgi:hypothetical protein
MSTVGKEQVKEILARLKSGSTLVKRKRNGEKFTRKFFLHEQEEFISYHRSEKITGNAKCCK